MSAPCVEACSPWATAADVCAPCNAYDFDAFLLESKLAVATDIIFRLTGRQWPGSCRETFRPCGTNTICGCYIQRNRHPDTVVSCGCRQLSEIEFGVYPVTEIQSVKVDGAELDPSLYRVDDFRTLVRLRDPDGSLASWPCCQDMSKPDTEADTFAVTVVWGALPPQGGVSAVATLACELALACSPSTSSQCRLPIRTQSFSRQNLSVTMVPESFFQGLTGLPEIDSWIKAVNPARLQREATAWSPDLPQPPRRVGT